MPESSGFASPSSSIAETGASVEVSTSGRDSHNDVFFRKRSETAASPGYAISSVETVEQVESAYAASPPVLAETILAQPVVADPVLPEPVEVTPALEVPALAEPEGFVAAPVQDQPFPQEAADKVQPSAPAMEASTSRQTFTVEVPVAESSPQEGGFLKRIFGRFHK